MGTVFLVTIFLAACGDDPVTVSVPPDGIEMTSQALEGLDGRPHYLFFGERIYIDPIPGRIWIRSQRAQIASVADEVLRDLGIAGLTRPEIYPAGYAVVELPPLSNARAQEVRQHLLQREEINFAVPIYSHSLVEGSVKLLDRAVIHFAPDADRIQIETWASAHGLLMESEPDPTYGWSRYWFTLPDDLNDPLAWVNALNSDEIVLNADIDKIQPAALAEVPTDDFFPQQWYLQNSITFNARNVDINVVRAWDITKGDRAASAGEITVAVVDEGVDGEHRELWESISPGFDAFRDNDPCLGRNGLPSTELNPCFWESHGTWVAGIIAAEHGDPLSGMAGVAPGARIVPIRLFTRVGPNPADVRHVSDAEAADAINFAWQFKTADVINGSFTWPPNFDMAVAIKSAVVHGRGGLGTTVVIAAGNTSNREGGIVGGVAWPARMDSVIAVSAIAMNGESTNYAPRGPEIDIVAPSGFRAGNCAGDILTIDPVGSNGFCDDGPSRNQLDYSTSFTGTSASAPQVSGVAALLYAENYSRSQGWIKSRLYDAADPWGSADEVGHGKLDAHGALTGQVEGETIGGSTEPCTPEPPAFKC